MAQSGRRSVLTEHASRLHPDNDPRYISLLIIPIYRIQRSTNQMALDMEKEIARHQQEWAGFAKMMFIGTVVVIAIVGIMGGS
jgi:hypothetical protein